MSISLFIRASSLGETFSRLFHSQLARWDIGDEDLRELLSSYVIQDVVPGNVLVDVSSSSRTIALTAPQTVKLYASSTEWSRLTSPPTTVDVSAEAHIAGNILTVRTSAPSATTNSTSLDLVWQAPTATVFGNTIETSSDMLPSLTLLPDTLLDLVAPESGWASAPFVSSSPGGWVGMSMGTALGTTGPTFTSQHIEGSATPSGEPATPFSHNSSSDINLFIQRSGLIAMGHRALQRIAASIREQIAKERSEVEVTWERGPTSAWIQDLSPAGAHHLHAEGRLRIHNVVGILADPRLDVTLTWRNFHAAEGTLKGVVRVDMRLDSGNVLSLLAGVVGFVLGGPLVAGALIGVGALAAPSGPMDQAGAQLDGHILENYQVLVKESDVHVGEGTLRFPVGGPFSLSEVSAVSAGLWIGGALRLPDRSVLGPVSPPPRDRLTVVRAVLAGRPDDHVDITNYLAEFERLGGYFLVDLVLGTLEFSGPLSLAHVYLDLEGGRGHLRSAPSRSNRQHSNSKAVFVQTEAIRVQGVASDREATLQLRASATELLQGLELRLGVRFRCGLGARQSKVSTSVKMTADDLLAAIWLKMNPISHDKVPIVRRRWTLPSPDPQFRPLREAIHDVVTNVREATAEMRAEIRDRLELDAGSDLPAQARLLRNLRKPPR